MLCKHESKSHSVMSDSLGTQGLYSPWNFPGQDTEVGSLSLLQGSSQLRDQTQVSHIAGRFFTNWAIREAHNFREIYIILLTASSSQLRDQTQVSRIVGRFFTSQATREAQLTPFKMMQTKSWEVFKFIPDRS